MGFRNDLYGSVPGVTTAQETFENHFRWGRDYAGLIVGGQLDGTARDSGNTPTTVLRPGLLLGQIASSGNLRDYGGNNTDGSDQVYGVLLSSFRMQDLDGNNTNRFVWVLAGGPVKAVQLLGLDEWARATMADRFIFDDRNLTSNTIGWNRLVAKTANYTVVNGTDNNTIFTTTGAAGEVDFTLPTTIKKGQRWKFYAAVDQILKVIAPAGKLVTFNNAAATSVALSTAGNKIGGSFEVIVDEAAAKYLVIPSGANTVTVA